jgi:hypothetical protein
MEIRPAEPADRRRVATLARDSFQSAYALIRSVVTIYRYFAERSGEIRK